MIRRLISAITLALALVAFAAIASSCSTDFSRADSGEEGQTADSTEGTENGEATADGDGKQKDKDGKSRRGKKDGDDDEDEEPEAVPVEVVSLETGPIESVLRASTNLEAERSVEVFSQTQGLVLQLLTEEGRRVSKGQLLVKVEDHEQRNQVSLLESQLARSKREYERQQRLHDQKLISDQAFNEATYELDQLEIQLDNAKTQLGYTEIRAPISGTITMRDVNRGDRVQPGQMLFSMVDFNSIVAKIYVPEKELSRLQKGLEARVRAQASSGQTYSGKLIRIAPVVDARSGTVKATVGLGGQRGLMPGMYVDVELITATEKEALLVPKRALILDGEQSFVYVVDPENKAKRVLVMPALENPTSIQPANDTLAVGDRIVIAGQAGLKDGTLLSVIGEEMDTAEASTASESGE